MNVLKGINVPTRAVGWARAILLAVIVAAIEAAIRILTGESFDGAWAAYAPIAVLILRALETEADHRLKPDQNTTPAPSVTGSVVTLHIDGQPVTAVAVKPPSTPPSSTA